MTDATWLLHGAVLGASFVQSATGLGFGIIAGPVILIVMNDGAAIQVSILLSFAIAIVLAPGLRAAIDRRLLARLAAGVLVGAPAGAAAFRLVNVETLKVLAGIAVVVMAGAAAGVVRGHRHAAGAGVEGGIGALCGAMTATLAMPGPPVAAYMAARDRASEVTRATILALFTLAFPIAYLCQALSVGVSGDALSLAGTLLPATALGMVTGRLAAPRLDRRVVRRAIVAILLATAAGLFASL